MSRPRVRWRWLGPALGVVGLVTAYYAWPVREEGSGLVVGVLVTLVAVGLLGYAIFVQVRRHLVHGEDVGFPALAMLVSMVVVVFAFGYYRLELASPGQMAGLETKTDSLYFTLLMLTTVGLGDVHPVGQVARTLAVVQLVFDLVFVAAAGSLLAGSIRDRLRSKDGGTA